MASRKRNTDVRMTRGVSPLALACVVVWSGAAGNVACADASDGAEARMTREQWHSRLRWPTADCPLQSPDPTRSAVHVRPFGPDAVVIDVECERWAYQGTRLLYLRKGSNVTLLSFEQFDAPEPGRLDRHESALVTGSVTVRPAQQAIDVLRVYRGPGDCGQHLRYQVRDAKAVLMQKRVRECSGRPSAKNADPETWPLRK